MLSHTMVARALGSFLQRRLLQESVLDISSSLRPHHLARHNSHSLGLEAATNTSQEIHLGQLD